MPLNHARTFSDVFLAYTDCTVLPLLCNIRLYFLKAHLHIVAQEFLSSRTLSKLFIVISLRYFIAVDDYCMNKSKSTVQKLELIIFQLEFSCEYYPETLET